MKTDKNKIQGKESTADTNTSYNQNANQVKGSTTSQNSTTSSNNAGVGGNQKPSRMETDVNKTSRTMKPDTNKKNAK